MKSKLRPVFTCRVLAVVPPLLVQTAAAQLLYWAAPENKSGNRDGVWSTNVRSWSNVPGGPPTTAWVPNGNGIANFTAMGAATVTTTSLILLRGIVSNTTAPVTLTGAAPLRINGLGSIEVANAPLILQNRIDFPSGGSLVKTGFGELDLRGRISPGLFEINEGLVTLSGENIADTGSVVNRATLRLKDGERITNYTQHAGELARAGSDYGNGTLTVTGTATLYGGSVTGRLYGKTEISGDVAVPGWLGGPELNIRKGTLTLAGSSSSSTVNVLSGAGLNVTNSGLASGTVLNNAGTLTLGASDTVSRLIQTHGSLVSAPGTFLTATNGAVLYGGSIKGGLIADIDVRGMAHIDGGTIQGERLTLQQSVSLILNGPSSHREVTLLGNSSLETYGHLADDAVVTTDKARQIMVRADDTIRRLDLNGGSVGGAGTLTVTDGITVREGSLNGRIHGDLKFVGGPNANFIDGHVSGGTLEVAGQLDLFIMGSTAHQRIIIGENAALINRQANFSPTASVFTAGYLSSTPFLNLHSFHQTGGSVLGSNLTTSHGIFISGGSMHFNLIEGNVTVSGDARIGSRLDGDLKVNAGHATLGTVLGTVTVAEGAKLTAIRLAGNVVNHGSLVISDSRNYFYNPLEVGGDFRNTGTMEFRLENTARHDSVKINGTATLGGELLVNNVGEGLAAGEIAQLIKASTIVGAFESVRATGFETAVIFDDATGRLIGMAGETSGPGGTYLNLNRPQTNIYLSLYEDAIGADETNVTSGGLQRATAAAAKNTPATLRFLTGPADGDPQLVAALNAATFTQPGLISQPVINHLSPEVHRGMADYTRQALRSHVREAATAAPFSGRGKTHVFASTHTTSDGVESGRTAAGYQFETSGVTAGLRHALDTRTRAGALLGVDTGTIEGGLIDTDADNLTLGLFGSRVLHDKTQTAIHAGIAWTSGTFDTRRDSFGGEATAEDIGSKAVELSLGASGVAWQGRGLTVRPHAEIRHTHGSVDSFTETGPGVPLDVAGQDIDAWLAELGVETSWKIRPNLELAGNLGWITGIGDSGETLGASFLRSGPGGRRFSVTAPGVEDDALVLGLGLYYDVTDTIRAGLTWQGELRDGDTDSHSFGLGATWSF